MANDVVAVRSIEIVTAEIHTIRDNVARVFMDGVVQIGRRLEEAKQLVPQGEWLQYLDKELGYKPSTAQNYMRIAREFGDGQVGLSGKTPGDFFGNLGYSQLLPLLGLPEEEREQLAEQHDLAGMSSREIQALVRERDEAKANADKLQKDVGHLKDKLEDADKDISDYLSPRGVYAPTTTYYNNMQVRQLFCRSRRVNPKLTKEKNLAEAVSAVWRGWYVLVLPNGHAYVADGNQDRSDNGYECTTGRTSPRIRCAATNRRCISAPGTARCVSSMTTG